jgi:uncharacterized membrane protein
MNAIRAMIPLALLFIVCDAPWLLLNSAWSHQMFKAVQGGTPLQFRLEAAIPVYLALAYLVQLAHSTTEAFILGVCVYAVYDFTNYATLAKYELSFAIADSLWGGALFSIVRYIAIYLNIL